MYPECKPSTFIVKCASDLQSSLYGRGNAIKCVMGGFNSRERKRRSAISCEARDTEAPGNKEIQS